MTSTPEEFRGMYVTQAVESVVYDENRDLLGHVGLFDLDDVDRDRVVSTAEHAIDGPVVVLESSPRSFHLWALTVRSLEEWTEIARSLAVVDDAHTALNRERERSVLRVAAKVDLETGEEAKPRPSFEHYAGPVSPEEPVSEPHVDVLDDVLEDGFALDTLALVGDSTDRRVYMADVGGRGGEQA